MKLSALVLGFSFLLVGCLSGVPVVGTEPATDPSVTVTAVPALETEEVRGPQPPPPVVVTTAETDSPMCGGLSEFSWNTIRPVWGNQIRPEGMLPDEAPRYRLDILTATGDHPQNGVVAFFVGDAGSDSFRLLSESGARLVRNIAGAEIVDGLFGWIACMNAHGHEVPYAVNVPLPAEGRVAFAVRMSNGRERVMAGNWPVVESKDMGMPCESFATARVRVTDSDGHEFATRMIRVSVDSTSLPGLTPTPGEVCLLEIIR